MSFTPIERAEAYIQAGELTDALDALNEHLSAHPDDDQARRMRIGVLSRSAHSDPAHAEMHLRAALDDVTQLSTLTIEDQITRYQLHLRLGGDAAGHQLLLDLIAERDGSPRDLRLIELLLESLYRRGESAQAIQLLFDLPKTWRYLQWNGDFHALNGDHRVALDYYCSALDQLDETTQHTLPSGQPFIANLRAQILLRRAEMYRTLALFKDAAVDLADAEALIPKDMTIRFKRGVMLYLSGQHEDGLSLCRSALDAAKPDSLQAEMLRSLDDDERYAPIRAALFSDKA